MNIHSSEMLLYSKDHLQLAQFFSDIFDREIHSDKNSFSLELGNTTFLFLRGVGAFKQNSLQLTVFQLCFTSESELKELLKKIEFYYYRLDLKKSIPEIEADEMGNLSFTLEDFDNRRWIFKVKKSN